MKPTITLFVLVFFSSAVSFFAQAKVPLTEWEGYEFWGKGRLENLKLGVSTRADIKNIFGDSCISKCDLNDDWSVAFDYFNILRKWEKDGQLYNYYLANPDYKDRLYRVFIFPKEHIASEALKITCGSTVTFRNCKPTGYSKAGNETPPYKVTYSIKAKGISGCSGRKEECRRIIMNFIEYTVTDDLEEKMFIFQSSSASPPDDIRN